MSFNKKEYSREYYKKNIEKIKEYRLVNREKRNAYSKKWRQDIKNKDNYQEIKERDNARTLAWYHENFEKIKEKKYARDKAWRDKNKHIINTFTAKRRIIRLQRTPTWLTEENKEQIKIMYALALHLSETTEHEWQVDHIIPLQGKNVSGLHVPENLQVIERSINSKKRNKYEPE